MDVGSKVRVLDPFAGAFPNTYTVVLLAVAEDGQDIVLLEGIESAFAPGFLEEV